MEAPTGDCVVRGRWRRIDRVDLPCVEVGQRPPPAGGRGSAVVPGNDSGNGHAWELVCGILLCVVGGVEKAFSEADGQSQTWDATVGSGKLVANLGCDYRGHLVIWSGCSCREGKEGYIE